MTAKGPFGHRVQNGCLKRCENCGLKSIVEKCVFGVCKKKKKKVFGIMV